MDFLNINLMSAEDEALLNSINNTDCDIDFSKSIIDLFDEQVSRNAGKVAIVFKNQTTTYEEIDNYSSKIANFLISQGVKSGDSVGILFEQSLDLYAAILGVMKTGAIFIPIDPEMPNEKLNHIINTSVCNLIISYSHHLNKLEVTNVITVLLNELLPFQKAKKRGGKVFDVEDIHKVSSLKPALKIEANNASYVIFTSGSTGKPKGVKIRNKSIINFVNWLGKLVNVNNNSNCGQSASIFFDASLQFFLTALCHGATLYPVPNDIKLDPAAFIDWLQVNKINHIDFVPSLWYSIIDFLALNKSNQTVNFPDFKNIIIGGEALSTSKVTLWQNLVNQGPSITNVYGPTECTINATFYQIKGKQEGNVVKIGRPLQNMQIYILDEEGGLCLPNVTGELYIGGVGVAEGYVGAPLLTQEKFITNKFKPGSNEILYKTGDLCKILLDGNIQFIGRNDQQIKLHGYRIELSEIEGALLYCENIANAAVVYDATDEDTGKLIAYYVSKIPSENNQKKIKAQLKEILSDYMIPGKFVELKEIPRLANNKIDKSKLKEFTLDNVSTNANYVPPSTKTEKLLAKIWGEILSLDKVSINEDFFDAGGDSMLVILFRHKCLENNINIKVKDFFKNPTISDLANIIDMECNVESAPIATQQSSFHKKLSEDELSHLPGSVIKALPLLPMQKSMLFAINNADSKECPYIVQARMRYKGKIHANEFQIALQQVVKRHEALRTIYNIGLREEPLQIILDNIETIVSFNDVSIFAESMREKQVEQLMQSSLQSKHNLENGPFIQIIIIKEGEDDFSLVWNMLHIVTDGWSMSVIQNDLLTIYNSLVKKESLELPPVKAEFSNYVEYCLNHKSDLELEKSWKLSLDNESDFSIPSINEPWNLGDEEYLISLDQATSNRVQQLSKKSQMPLAVICLSIYALLLHKISNQRHITIGLINSGRSVDFQYVEDCVGCLIKTHPLIISFDNVISFLDVIKQAHNCITLSNESGLLDLEDIQKICNKKIKLDNLFLFQNYLQTDDAVYKDLKWDFIGETSQETTGFPLTTVFYVENEKLHVKLKYKKSYFTRDTVNKWSQIFSSLLYSVVADDTQSVAKINILNKNDYQAWGKVNNNSKDYNMTSLVSAIQKHVLSNPNSPAIKIEDTAYTYSMLSERSDLIAQTLINLGVNIGDKIIIALPRSFDLYATIFAAMKIDAIYVPVDIDVPIEKINYIITDSCAKVIVLDSNTSQSLTLGESKLEKMIIDQLEASAGNIHLNDHINQVREKIVNPEIYLIYTSGTTGKPKGVKIQENSLINFICWFNDSFSVTSNSKLCQNASISFDASHQAIFSALTQGACLVPVKDNVRRNPREFLQWLDAEKITHFDAVPSHWASLLKEAESTGRKSVSLQSLEWIILGGESLYYNQTNQWSDVILGDSKIAHVYGPTEATINSSWINVDLNITQGKIPIGLPLPNYSMYVVDDNQNLLPPFIYGELIIGGDGLMLGYQNEDITTGLKLIDLKDANGSNKFYCTGDIGRLELKDGKYYFEYYSRYDSQVKIDGMRIELGGIEAQINALTDVKAAAVVVRDTNNVKQLICFYVAENDLEQEIQSHLSSHFLLSTIPSVLIRVEHLLYTSSSKIDRKALLNLYENSKSMTAIDEPATETEIVLSECWSTILKLTAPIPVSENVFNYGITSLEIFKFLSMLAYKTNHVCKIKDVYNFPTINKLAKYIDNTLAKQRDSHLNFKTLNFDNGDNIIKINEYFDIAASVKNIMVKSNKAAFVSYPLSSSNALLLKQCNEYLPNTFINLELNFNLDVSVLSNVIESIVHKHALLRSQLEDHCLTVYEVSEFKLPMIEVGNKDSLKKIETEINNEFGRYDFPQFRLLLIKSNKNKYNLFWATSHLISDAVTISIILDEIKSGYIAAMDKQEYPLHHSEKTYGNYIETLKSIDDASSKYDGYIQNYLSSAHYFKTFINTHSQTSITFTKTLLIELDEYQIPSEYSLNNYFLAIASLAIARGSKAQSIPFLQYFHGRTYQQQNFFNVVGDLTDKLPLLINIKPDQQLTEVFHEINAVMKFIDYQNIYWSDLLNLYLQNGAEYAALITENCPLLFNFTESHGVLNNDQYFKHIQNEKILNAIDIPRIVIDVVRAGNTIEYSLLAEGIDKQMMENLWNINLTLINSNKKINLKVSV